MAAKKFVPFSNGTEAMSWTGHNCDHCKRRSSCSMKYALDYSFLSGEITQYMASRIGTNELGLQDRCNEYTETPIHRAKRKKPVDKKQTSIF